MQSELEYFNKHRQEPQELGELQKKLSESCWKWLRANLPKSLLYRPEYNIRSDPEPNRKQVVAAMAARRRIAAALLRIT